VQFALYATARRHYGTDSSKRRLDYTLPPLVLASLALATRVHAREEKKDESDTFTVKSKKVFGFVHEMVTVLAPHHSERALRLFLQAAQSADAAGFEAISYEFLAQALTIYEDEISDSKAQFQAITVICATLCQLRSLSEENYDTLITKATQHSAKLLKKEHACQAVFNCAHLFWVGPDSAPGHRDDRRVLECLQRSLKIANLCVGSQVHLFVEILNKYLYFYDRGCPSITTRYLKGLLALIDEHLPNLDSSELSQQAQRHYQNTLAHIKMRQAQDDAVGEKYRAISAPEPDG
jgi:vacuolar protein sorting-associated protein 35